MVSLNRHCRLIEQFILSLTETHSAHDSQATSKGLIAAHLVE